MNPDLQTTAPPDTRKRRRDLRWFVVLAVGFSWLVWLPLVFGYGASLGQVGALAGAFGPAVAALVLTWRDGHSVWGWVRDGLRWRVAVRWYIVALVVPVLVVGLAGLVLGLIGEPIDYTRLVERIPFYLPTLLFMAVLGGGQEELGWRGYALPALQMRFGPLVGTVILGVVWALWHLPLFAIEAVGQHGTSFLVYAAMVLPLTVLFTWLYNASHSVLLAVLLHASVNASLGVLVPLPLDVVAGEAFETVVLAIAIVLWVVALALLTVTGGRLGYDENVPAHPAAVAGQQESGAEPP